ncbi:hypothetical protein AVEN_179825-1 [Araneus ventricosus]|uniref:Uncharacterized protein n=1 Tax=Araneus ventricosus TaxID=182803 RepID=A0A4Y2FBA2_ARAVE|nr:hypothetical protein AVEN_179825-1 [Araneus ventricosus]
METLQELSVMPLVQEDHETRRQTNCNTRNKSTYLVLRKKKKKQAADQRQEKQSTGPARIQELDEPTRGTPPTIVTLNMKSPSENQKHETKLGIRNLQTIAPFLDPNPFPLSSHKHHYRKFNKSKNTFIFQNSQVEPPHSVCTIVPTKC